MKKQLNKVIFLVTTLLLVGQTTCSQNSPVYTQEQRLFDDLVIQANDLKKIYQLCKGAIENDSFTASRCTTLENYNQKKGALDTKISELASSIGVSRKTIEDMILYKVDNLYVYDKPDFGNKVTERKAPNPSELKFGGYQWKDGSFTRFMVYPKFHKPSFPALEDQGITMAAALFCASPIIRQKHKESCSMRCCMERVGKNNKKECGGNW